MNIRLAELKKKVKKNKIIAEIKMLLDDARCRKKYCRNYSWIWRIGLRKSSKIKWRRPEIKVIGEILDVDNQEQRTGKEKEKK